MNRPFFCAFAAVALTLGASAEDIKMEHLSFLSGGRRIGVDAFPAAQSPSAAVIVLHGAGGMASGNQYVRQLAAAVAAQGYSTYLVEYFDRTGTTYASDAVIHKNFELWLDTLVDAVSFVTKQPGVDAKRVGTFGYSLGAYLAVAHAARDPRVRATVELAGGLDPTYAAKVRRLPPLLIVHGEADRRVPFANGVELEKFARKLGSRVDADYYSGEGHVLSPLVALRALDRALKFFSVEMK